MKPRALTAALASLLILWGAAPATAQGDHSGYSEMLKRIPEQANAVLLMDVQGLLDSKIGLRELWKDEIARNRGKGISSPAGTKRLIMASMVNYQSLEQNYTLCLAEMDKTVADLGALARRERGFLEKINLMPAVWTPRDVYILGVTPELLAFVTPADRQTIEKGVQQTLIHPQDKPPGFADRAIFRANHKAQIALALDLTNAISPELSRQWAGSLPTVDKLKLDTEMIGRVFASAKSATLSVEVDDTIHGELRVEFEKSADYIKLFAEEAILQVLEDFGMSFPKLSSWTTVTEGNVVTMSGKMDSEGLRRLLSVLRPPTTTPDTPYTSRAASGNTPPGDGNPRAGAEPSPVDISKDYFHAVTDMLNGLKHEKSTSPRGASMWYDRYARQIDDLPILGVDKDLLDWGSVISKTLREMSLGINTNAKDQTYRIAGLANTTGSYYYGIANSESKGYNAAVIRKQSNAQMDVQLDEIWKRMEVSVADMRRKMVEKYKVDF